MAFGDSLYIHNRGYMKGSLGRWPGHSVTGKGDILQVKTTRSEKGNDNAKQEHGERYNVT